MVNYNNEEIIAHVNEQLRKDEEYMRQIRDTLEFKKRLRATELAKKVVEEQKISITDEELQQVVDRVLMIDDRKDEVLKIINDLEEKHQYTSWRAIYRRFEGDDTTLEEILSMLLGQDKISYLEGVYHTKELDNNTCEIS